MNKEDVTAIFRAIATKLGEPINVTMKKWFLDPFTYTINFVTPNQLAASATSTLQFICQADSAFVICRTTFVALSTANAAVANLQPYGSGGASSVVGVLCSLSDSGSGRALMDNPVPLDSIFGTGQYSGRDWPIPKILDPSSTLAATLQNLDATAYHIRLQFHGYKVFGDIAQWAALHK